MSNFFFIGVSTALTIVVAKSLHTEQHVLHELNDIYHNKKARVVIGRKKGEKLIKQMKKKADIG